MYYGIVKTVNTKISLCLAIRDLGSRLRDREEQTHGPVFWKFSLPVKSVLFLTGG